MQKNKILIAAATAVGVALSTFTILAQQDEEEAPEMGVFLTSVGQGNGGDLGGLAGADAHCQQLASNAGMGHRTWQAYLSTQGPGAVNARDRIGEVPGPMPMVWSWLQVWKTCTTTTLTSIGLSCWMRTATSSLLE